MDFLGIAVGGAALILTSLLSHLRNGYFWLDELASWSLVTDPSATHMVRAIARGAENNPPLYELIMRAWSGVFGASELSLRLATGVCAALALAVLWRVLRRHFAPGATSAGIAVAFFGSEPLFEQLGYARFYGLFMLSVALAVLAADNASTATRVSRRGLATSFLANLVLVFTHAFGGFYSAAILGATVLADFLDRRFRPTLYASVLAAWLVFAIWFPAIMSQSHMNEPRSWLVPPTRADLFALVHRQTLWLPIATLAIVALQAFARPGGRVSRADGAGQHGSARHLTLIGIAVICLVPANFVMARLSLPVFLDRYVLPSILGWSIVVAQVVNMALPDSKTDAAFTGRGHRITRIFWLTFFAALACFPPFYGARKPRVSRPAVALPADLRGVPVVVESAFDFWQLEHYAGRSNEPYQYLLDWELALDSTNAKSSVQEYKLVELYATEGYIPNGVGKSRDFLISNNRFLVVDSPEYIWFERRVRNDSSYKWSTVGDYHGMPVRLVINERSLQHP